MISIRTKIISGTCLIVTAAMLLSGGVLNNHIGNALKSQVLHDSEVKLQQAANQLSYALDDVVNLAQFIITDELLIDGLKQLEGSELDCFDQLRYEQNCAQRLVRMVSMRDSIAGAAVVAGKDRVIDMNPKWNTYQCKELLGAWYQELAVQDGQREFSQVHTLFSRASFSLAESDRKLEVVSYVCPIYDIDHPTTHIGTLILHVNSEHLLGPLRPLSADYDRLRILDNKGRILFSLSDTRANGVQAITPVSAGWKIESLLSNARIGTHMRGFLTVFYGTLAFALLSICTLLTWLTHNLTKPLSTLTQAMKTASDHKVQLPVEIHTHDELEVLAECYNNLMEELHCHMRRLVKKEQAQRDMHIQLLLSQINPHFVYNTLNSIIYMAEQQRCEDIISMTRSFIDILQNLVKIGGNHLMSTVEEEIELVCRYLELQRYRYPNRFTFELIVSPTTLTTPLPRTLLQPLIENALFHGVCPRCTPGHIRLTVDSSEEWLSISISDDGVGMTQEQCQTLLTTEQADATTDQLFHIGIVNIRQRLVSVYGSRARFCLESIPGHGTVVQITLPRDEAEHNTNDSAVYST